MAMLVTYRFVFGSIHIFKFKMLGLNDLKDRQVIDKKKDEEARLNTELNQSILENEVVKTEAEVVEDIDMDTDFRLITDSGTVMMKDDKADQKDNQITEGTKQKSQLEKFWIDEDDDEAELEPAEPEETEDMKKMGAGLFLIEKKHQNRFFEITYFIKLLKKNIFRLCLENYN